MKKNNRLREGNAVGTDMRGLCVDDQLFLLLQSMGYGPNIPLWQYQQHKRELQKRLDAASSEAKEGK